MLLFTDAQTGNAVAVNPDNVVVLFTATETTEDGVVTEKTIINTLTGNLVVKESYIDVLGQLQAV